MRPLLASGAEVSLLLCTSTDVKTNPTLRAAMAEATRPLGALLPGRSGGGFRSESFDEHDSYARHARCYLRLTPHERTARFILSTRPDLCLCTALPPLGQWPADAISSRARIYDGQRRLHPGLVSLVSAVLGTNSQTRANRCVRHP